MVLVSVIVPVYKAEKYLKRCVDSILSQTFVDFELVLVDDGSPDNSGEICDEFKELDNRVRVIHQENQGVGVARQVGLDTAKGDYAIFADPDDWVEPTMLEELVGKAESEKTDIVICDFIINNSETEGYLSQQKPKDLKPDTILRQLLTGSMHGSTCNKLYRVQTLKKHSAIFPEGINFCEDLWFNCKLFMHPDVTVKYLNKAYYHYDFFSNPLGLSRKLSVKSVDDYRRFIDFVCQSLDEATYDHELKELKFNAVKLAFRSDCNKKVFYSLFPDLIDSFKTQLTKKHMHFVMKYGLFLAMSGYLRLGRFLIYSYNTVYLPVSKLYHRMF